MTAKQHVVSLKEFARTMLEEEGSFTKRVRNFEERFGEADADTLAVLAQAALACRFHCEYENNLVETCRAIGREKPTSIYIHRHVPPERWTEMNTYVVGVQSWLGLDLPLPSGMDERKIERIKQWLGEHRPAKEALAELFLCNLIEHLWNTCLAKLAEDMTSEDAEYADFTSWYVRPDGRWYATGDKKAYVEKCEHRVRREIGSSSGEVIGCLGLENPLCMHRSSRRLNIQLAGIGALKARGNLPPDDEPKEVWRAFVDAADDGLRAWINGASPGGAVAIMLHDALGAPTERGRAIVRDFLTKGNDLPWRWFEKKRKEKGISAGGIFRGSDDGWWG